MPKVPPRFDILSGYRSYRCCFAPRSGSCRATDNLKSAVIKADRFDRGLSRTYAGMAAHYGTAICLSGSANRVSAPSRRHRSEPDGECEGRGCRRGGATLEVAVKTRFGKGARLRNHRFFSLAEFNVSIRRLSDELNMRLMRGYGASRADLFTRQLRGPPIDAGIPNCKCSESCCSRCAVNFICCRTTGVERR